MSNLRLALIGLLAGLALGEKVDVRFYGESLCPDCTGFTTTTLKTIFTSDLSHIMSFRYIGWGNVRKQGDSYACQHGPVECKINTVLNCAQDLAHDQFQFFEFLYCIESQAGQQVEAQIPGCTKLARLKLNALEACYNGKHGKILDTVAQNETDSLQPPHTYVPWVTINEQPIFDAVNNLGTFICAAYKGPRPSACSIEPSNQLGHAVSRISDFESEA